MRRTLVTLGIVGALAVLTLPRDAQAMRLRLGGFSIVDPVEDTKFAIGIDSDMRFIPFLGLNYGALYSVDGDGMYTDAYLGIRLFFPVAMNGKLEVTLRGDFLMKYFHSFEDNIDDGIALGGVTGPGLLLDVGPASLSFDLDVQIFSFVYPDKYDALDTHVALVYVFGVGF